MGFRALDLGDLEVGVNQALPLRARLGVAGLFEVGPEIWLGVCAFTDRAAP